MHIAGLNPALISGSSGGQIGDDFSEKYIAFVNFQLADFTLKPQCFLALATVLIPVHYVPFRSGHKALKDHEPYHPSVWLSNIPGVVSKTLSCEQAGIPPN